MSRPTPFLSPVAVLYQTSSPPAVDGVVKPLKLGGYSEPSADIAAALVRAGVPVVRPSIHADPSKEFDWIYGDDDAAIEAALAAGARTLWANTVLHSEHALMRVQAAHSREIRVVGHAPRLVERVDDKFCTNARLAAEQQLAPVARSVLVGDAACTYYAHRVLALSSLPQSLPFSLPAVAKPLRGRGSQGVALCSTTGSLLSHVHSLLAQPLTYGALVMVEECLPGEEITVAVLPPGRYSAPIGQRAHHWALPVVVRVGHVDGVAPYNGVVAVAANSEARESDAYDDVRRRCADIARLLDATSVMRIDCRANAKGEYVPFDVNMKPNMTGPGRPGRDEQTSLVGLAAQAVGWSYETLLTNILAQAAALTQLQSRS